MTFPSRLRRAGLKTAFAVHLREEMTDAERRVWAVLRSKQVAGLKFRQQQPLGPYVADFPNADAFRNRHFIIDAIVPHLEEHDIPLPDPAAPDRPSLKGRVEE